MAAPTLVCAVGLPYSGKSTWAREQGHPIVCPDEIRLALHGQRYEPRSEGFVWSIAKVMVRALFGSGHETVILDACNVSAERRDEWLSDEWETRYHLLNVPPVMCIDRALAAGDQEIIPVIHRMAGRFQPDLVPA